MRSGRTIFTATKGPHAALGGQHGRVMSARSNCDRLLSLKAAAYLNNNKKQQQQRKEKKSEHATEWRSVWKASYAVESGISCGNF